MAKRTRWTDTRREKFLQHLRETGNVTVAARAVGFSRSRVYMIKDEDPTFAQEWENAEREAADLLEKEAYRRAVEGVDEPVFYQGIMVSTIRKYSDALLTLLLKGTKPEKFRERFEHSGPEGKPLELVKVYLPDNGR